MLVIQNGGTLTDAGGFLGNFPGWQGTVTVSGAGSTWTNSGTLVVGGLGTGTLTIQDGGTVTSGGGGSIGLAAATGTVTVTGPGSSWINKQLGEYRRAQYRQLRHGHAHDRERRDGHQYHPEQCQHRRFCRLARHSDGDRRGLDLEQPVRGSTSAIRAQVTLTIADGGSVNAGGLL